MAVRAVGSVVIGFRLVLDDSTTCLAKSAVYYLVIEADGLRTMRDV